MRLAAALLLTALARPVAAQERVPGEQTAHGLGALARPEQPVVEFAYGFEIVEGVGEHLLGEQRGDVAPGLSEPTGVEGVHQEASQEAPAKARELLRREGHYFELYNSQFAAAVQEEITAEAAAVTARPF